MTSGSHKCWTSWLLRPIRAIFHMLSECEEPGCFYIHPPSQVNKSSIKGMGILRSNPHHLPTARIHRTALGKIHSIMAIHCSSSSRPSSPRPGDWERCFVPHNKLLALQTKGLLPQRTWSQFEPGLLAIVAENKRRAPPILLKESGCASSPI